MAKRGVRRWLIVVEIIGIFAAVIAAAGIFLSWRLQSGPIALNILRPGIALAIDRQLGDKMSCDVEKIFLYRDQDDGNLSLVLSNFIIVDNAENEVARAGRITISISPTDVFSRLSGPNTVIAENVAFRIFRNEDGNVIIPKVFQSETDKQKKPRLFSFNQTTSAFRRAQMENAKVTFVDAASGRSWVSQNASVLIERSDDAIDARLVGDIDMGDRASSIDANARYQFDGEIISADIAGNNFPLSDVLSTFFGDQAAIINAPVSGRAVLEFSTAGDVNSSLISAKIEDGVFRLGGADAPIQSIEWTTTFNPRSGYFDVEKLDYDVAGNRGSFSGNVGLKFANNIRAPESIDFSLAGSGITLNYPSRLEAPLNIENVELRGGYQISDRRLTFDNFAVAAVDAILSGDFQLHLPRPTVGSTSASPGIKATIELKGALDPINLMKIWPLGVGSGARDWVKDRLDTAVIENVIGVVNLEPGAVAADGAIPDDAIDVEFDIRDAKAFYVSSMTPLTNAAGHGRLRGNSFVLKAERGNVGQVQLRDGEVDFPEFMPKWQPTYIRFNASGASESILGVLDQYPLQLLSKINLSPDQFAGAASARVEIMRPNKRDVDPDEYEYRGMATFSEMKIDDVFGNASLTGAGGEVELQPRYLTVKSKATLSDRPIDIVWRQNFFESDGPSTFDISGTADASFGDVIGLPVRRFVHGPVNFDANLTGELGAFETAKVNADFDAATLTLDVFGWRKHATSAASGEIELIFGKDGLSIPSLILKGEDISIIGNIAFAQDRSIASAAFPEFWLKNAADFSVKAQRDVNDELEINLLGRHLNAAPMLDSVIQSNAGAEGGLSWGRGVRVTARIDALKLRNDVEYKVAAFDLWRSAQQLEALNFTAFAENNSPITIKLSETGSAENQREQTITAQTESIGSFMNGVFGFNSIVGGAGSVTFTSPDDAKNGLTGVIAAHSLKVVDAPLLARLFSAGSFQGVANLLNGEGIDLTNVFGAFALDGGVLSLSEFRATGPSIGVTANGQMALSGEQSLALSGSIAPLYQVNSFMKDAPIIGDILAGTQGQGIVALSYSVSGSRNAPTVIVNPLTALTPGIFRQIFQGAASREITLDEVTDDDGAEVTEPEKPRENTPASDNADASAPVPQ